jgi:Tol biopolymer transport system component
MTPYHPERLTPLDSKNQHLYFTTPSVTHDLRWLLMISERLGTPNLFAMETRTGETFAVSRAIALQYSYVYAEGGPAGFCKASPALDADRNRIYWVEDDALWRCPLGNGAVGPRERVATLPATGWLGFSHVSADGRYFAIPIADKAAFEPEDVDQYQQMKNVPHRMVQRGLGTKLAVVDVETGSTRVWATIPFWVTHVQFSPGDNSRMIFNSEGSYWIEGDPHTRVWVAKADGSYRKLFHLDGNENASHENWSFDGGFITSHGSYVGEQFGKGWVQAHAWDGTRLWREPLGGIEIGHATCLNNSRSFAVDEKEGWISILDLDGPEGRPALRRLCRHDSSWKSQDVHPHPVMTPDGRSIIFTSDCEGTAAIYQVTF